MQKEELKKKLFKQVFGAMIDVEFCALSEEEVVRTVAVAVRQFSDAYSVKRAIAKQEFSELGNHTEHQISWATYGMKDRLANFKNNIISGATAQ